MDLQNDGEQKNLSNLFYATANHNRNFQWLGFDKERISIYASIVKKNGRFCEIKLFRLNLLTKTFDLCKTFESSFKVKTFFALALSEDGSFFGILRKSANEKSFLFYLFSLVSGQIVDRINVTIPQEIDDQIRYRCSLKNLTKLGWLIHFESENRRNFHRILLDGGSASVEESPFMAVELSFFKKCDSLLQRTSNLMCHLVTEEGERNSSSLNTFVVNLDDYADIFMERSRENPRAMQKVNQTYFLPFLSNELQDQKKNITLTMPEVNAEDGFKKALFAIVKDVGFSGGCVLRSRDVRENGCGDVGTELLVVQFSIGVFPSLERLAAETLFSKLENRRLNLHNYSQNIHLPPSLFKKYVVQSWMTDIETGSATNNGKSLYSLN